LIQQSNMKAFRKKHEMQKDYHLCQLISTERPKMLKNLNEIGESSDCFQIN